ncbi:MAG: succinylglutamate desuccinylase/aspartoacylase family protein [Vicingaceae bacterium]
MKRQLSINREIIQAGEKAVINLNIARLISGTQIDLPIHVYRSMNPGPVVLLSGGLHGDEVDGIEIIRRMINSSVFDKLNCGSVIAIPVMNIYGFLNFSREVPDGKDVNRSFPGNKKGSLAALMAYNLMQKVVAEIDIGIDFHTGGANRYNSPQTRYNPKDERAKEIAMAFNAPLSLASNLIDKSLRKEAYKMGKSIVVYEGGESMRFDEDAIKKGILGAKNVLNHLGMIDFKSKKVNSYDCLSSSWIRAKSSGLIQLKVNSGEAVERNQLLALITDPFGNFETKIKAPKKGVIIGHSNAPLVNKGDALFHLGTM